MKIEVWVVEKEGYEPEITLQQDDNYLNLIMTLSDVTVFKTEADAERHIQWNIEKCLDRTLMYDQNMKPVSDELHDERLKKYQNMKPICVELTASVK